MLETGKMGNVESGQTSVGSRDSVRQLRVF